MHVRLVAIALAGALPVSSALAQPAESPPAASAPDRENEASSTDKAADEPREAIERPPPADWDAALESHVDPHTMGPRAGPAAVRRGRLPSSNRKEVRRDDAQDASDAALDDRLAFLTRRIAAQRTHAEVWWTGFTALYAGGLVWQSVQAGAEGDDAAERADLVVSAVKAAGGFIRMGLDPYGGIRGTGDFEGLPERTAADKRYKIAQAEKVLRHNAENTDAFGPWYGHLINVAINGLGGVIVGAGFGDWQQGMISAGIGTAVGGASLLLAPWEADEDLEAYSSRFGVEPAGDEVEPPTMGWSVVPTPGGGGIRVVF